MIVTEEEAKTKRCQEAFPAADALSMHGSTESVPASSIPMMGFASGAGAMGFARYTAPTNCVGSACMAWRWGEWAEDPTTRQRLGGIRGYCGKAGKP